MTARSKVFHLLAIAGMTSGCVTHRFETEILSVPIKIERYPVDPLGADWEVSVEVKGEPNPRHPNPAQEIESNFLAYLTSLKEDSISTLANHSKLKVSMHVEFPSDSSILWKDCLVTLPTGHLLVGYQPFAANFKAEFALRSRDGGLLMNETVHGRTGGSYGGWFLARKFSRDHLYGKIIEQIGKDCCTRVVQIVRRNSNNPDKAPRMITEAMLAGMKPLPPCSWDPKEALVVALHYDPPQDANAGLVKNKITSAFTQTGYFTMVARTGPAQKAVDEEINHACVSDPTCLARIGKEAKADKILIATVKITPEKKCNISLAMADVAKTYELIHFPDPIEDRPEMMNKMIEVLTNQMCSEYEKAMTEKSKAK